MKKVIVAAVLVLLLFLIGCNYRSANKQNDNAIADEDSLIDEIAQIEAELKAEEIAVEQEVKEEVVLPELSDQPSQKEVMENEMQVVTVKENERVSLKPKINDADGDPITFTFSQPLNEQGEWKTNHGDAGEYVVSLSATDGVLTTTKNIKLVVERVNVAPVISPVQDITVPEGEIVNFKPTVTDPNGDSVSVTVSEPLKSATFTTDHTSAGQYKIKVTANDGELESESMFTVTVTDVNSIPVIADLSSIQVKEGETVTIQPTVTDLDNDAITITVSEPIGNDGVWETGYQDNGEYTITITANDGKDTVTKNVALVVTDVNVAPEIVDIIVEKN
ncbi:MAG: hypothetical protein Q8R37_01685 [Nanoarchaeota archaeon]|nr:hypothetical protein [Nanoarchaeota archaeon]